jgi:hypothetical protein
MRHRQLAEIAETLEGSGIYEIGLLFIQTK